MILALLLVPFLAGMAAFGIRSDRWRRGLLFGTALAHLGLSLTAGYSPPTPLLDGWLALDTPGLLFLGITSILFLAAAAYGIGYLRRDMPREHQDYEEGF